MSRLKLPLPWRRGDLRRGLFLFGLAGVTVGLILALVSFWPTPEGEAYRAADQCAGVPAAPTQSCWISLPARVIRQRQTYGRGGNHYYYRLDVNGTVTVARVNAFLMSVPRFWTGDLIQVRVWIGRVVAMSDGTSTFETTDAPTYRALDLRRAAGYLAVAAWLPFLLAVLHHWWRALKTGRGQRARAA